MCSKLLLCLLFRECNWGGGMSDEMCSQLDIDGIRRSIDIIKDENSPGKRSVQELDPELRRYVSNI